MIQGKEEGLENRRLGRSDGTKDGERRKEEMELKID